MLSEQGQELEDFIKSVIDEELENYFNSNLSEESGGSYSQNTAGNKDNIARKAHKREYEAKYGKCNGDLHHPNGLSSSKVVCEPASKNRGRPGEGGRKKGKKKRDPQRGRKTKKSLSEQENQLQTVGDLRAALNGAVKAKKAGQSKEAVKDVAVGFILDAIPGGGTAKSLWDIATAYYKLPDDKKTNTGLDYLNVDDQVSAIVDDNIENSFLKTLFYFIQLNYGSLVCY